MAIGVVLAVGVAIGYTIRLLSHQDHYSVADQEEIFSALLQISEKTIPKENQYCVMDEPLTVGEFVSAYISWSFNQEQGWNRGFRITLEDRIYHLSKLACDDGNVRHCRWYFGNGGPEGVGWRTELRFTYDMEKKSIDPAHVSCDRW